MRGELFLNGSAYGAGFSANAAFDALFGIDLILAVAFGNSLYRALCCASTASDASISNLISHIFPPTYT